MHLLLAILLAAPPAARAPEAGVQRVRLKSNPTCLSPPDGQAKFRLDMDHVPLGEVLSLVSTMTGFEWSAGAASDLQLTVAGPEGIGFTPAQIANQIHQALTAAGFVVVQSGRRCVVERPDPSPRKKVVHVRVDIGEDASTKVSLGQ